VWGKKTGHPSLLGREATPSCLVGPGGGRGGKNGVQPGGPRRNYNITATGEQHFSTALGTWYFGKVREGKWLTVPANIKGQGGGVLSFHGTTIRRREGSPCRAFLGKCKEAQRPLHTFGESQLSLNSKKKTPHWTRR